MLIRKIASVKRVIFVLSDHRCMTLKFMCPLFLHHSSALWRKSQPEGGPHGTINFNRALKLVLPKHLDQQQAQGLRIRPVQVIRQSHAIVGNSQRVGDAVPGCREGFQSIRD
jgi:hypothetical protein